MRNVSAEQKWIKRLQASGALWEMVDNGGGCKGLEGGELVSVRVLLPSEKRADVLLVVKARRGAEDFVGFVGGPDTVTAFLMWRRKERGEGLRFRREKPWEG